MRYRGKLEHLAGALLLLVAFAAPVVHAAADKERKETVSSTFAVEGMTCGGCEAGVELKVKKLEGVESAEASYRAGKVQVVYDPRQVTPERIVAAVQELGYKARLLSTEPAGK